jgi:hypothetical protein
MGSSRTNTKKLTMPISNEIFEHYRIQERVKLIKNAIDLLKLHGYTIVDLEGQIIKKEI